MQITLFKDSRAAMPAVSDMRMAPNATDPPAAPTACGAVGVGGNDSSSRPYSEDVIVPYPGFRQTRTILQKLTLLAGVIGLASSVAQWLHPPATHDAPNGLLNGVKRSVDGNPN